MASYAHVAVLLSLLVTTGVSQSCNRIFDSEDCVYDVFYSSRCDMSIYSFQIGNLEYDIDRNCQYHSYNGYVPIKLQIIDTGRNNFMEQFNNIDTNIINLIIALNMSHNEYYIQEPNLIAMRNLATLDVSSNHLAIAKLTNTNELPSLTSINLSNNIIKKIDVSSGEYVYERLTHIDLSHNYLVSLPDAIFHRFRELEYLDLSYNYIDAVTPITFEGCQNLLYLNMTHNRISDINSSLIRFSKLITLSFKNNKLYEVKRSDLDSLTNLKRLDLSSNSIANLDANAFDNMNLLTSLDLSGNQLKTIAKQMFANLNDLKEINLAGNHFLVLPRGIFKGKTVSSFLIQDNALTGSIVRGTFEGLQYVTQLDLGNQQLSTIEDYAFFGLENVQKILLNNNNIQSLSKNCFKLLQHLYELDLSDNRITNLDFNKDDLANLQSLLLRNNHITEVRFEYFHNLNSLQFLDLSYNNISHLDTDSFKSLKELTNFEISNNPLSGALEENTFEGLNSLPSLDISRSMLTAICNNSFMSMIQLRDLNVSYSKINELQYNAFHKTGAIQSIDLSFNQLDVFNVNATELTGLRTLFLDGNRLTIIGKDTLRGFINLIKISFSNNNLLNVDDDAFTDQKDLRSLDLSYNPHLNLNVSAVRTNYNLNNLYLKGITCALNLTYASNIPIFTIDISYAKLKATQTLNLQQLTHLDSLVLNNNNIVKLNVTSFANLKTLRKLDVSYNKIKFIQPGTFLDNTLLHTLNISHNALTTLGYGIFRRLTYLHTLDMSFNEIDSLQNERFYEVSSLSVLIADHNRGTSLSTLSIGENPIPCDLLVNLRDKNLPFEITAIRLEETSDYDNIHGVICNGNTKAHTALLSDKHDNEEGNKILIDIRDILLRNNKITENKDTNMQPREETKYEEDNNSKLFNMSNTIEKIANNIYRFESNVGNITSQILNENNLTNSLLGKISKFLSTHWHAIYTPVKENGSQSLMPYIEAVKSDLENSIAEGKEKMDEMNKKIAIINSEINSMRINDAPKHEKYVATESHTQTESLFTKTCLALILSILVCIILYKFYKSRMFIRNRLSISTRELPGAMEHSAL
ncbi:chaoptin-like [Manduca sexta]|uniref:chaoptin-like n=1 Tax=Manduca sexta TaxID=7130 RepID=UPI00188EFB0B|nr:chaoptin-like [Manduca sexta]